MYADYLASALVTLLVTVDPPGLAPIFLSVTRGMTAEERRRVATRAALIAFCILAFFGLGGEVLLRLLGVGLPAFRIAGGLLLFWIAFEMVFERRNDRKQQTAEVAVTQDLIRNVAAFPLAMPLMAGPGAITAMILLAGRAEGSAARARPPPRARRRGDVRLPRGLRRRRADRPPPRRHRPGGADPPSRRHPRRARGPVRDRRRAGDCGVREPAALPQQRRKHLWKEE